ncbi:unnamed protein product [Danaus chrysippus]|uniref:(African queen) hypothetical protein n=1 Tax=Danaus chrysippus TaxID=151541 RepID=A0A8J2W7V5_9NEOP|nr:unnamed protein product [Danaus chrysippus]
MQSRLAPAPIYPRLLWREVKSPITETEPRGRSDFHARKRESRRSLDDSRCADKSTATVFGELYETTRVTRCRRLTGRAATYPASLPHAHSRTLTTHESPPPLAARRTPHASRRAPYTASRYIRASTDAFTDNIFISNLTLKSSCPSKRRRLLA